MKKHVPSNKNGAILVIVMAVLVAFSLMVVALLQLGSFNEMETIRQLRITQAHWLAEAGLERMLSRIFGSKTYRDGMSELSTSFSSDESSLLGGWGSYEVKVSRTNINSVLADYSILSAGAFSNGAMVATDTVRLNFRGADGSAQPLIALGGNSSIANGINMIYGSIYCDGNLDVGNNTVISEVVDVTGNLTGSQVKKGDLPDPVVSLPIGEYTNRLYYASTNNPGVVTNSTTSTLAFNGGTNYVRGNLTINGNIPANETLVVTGSVTVANGITIGAGSKITAGGSISFGNHVKFLAQTEIFTMANISFDTQGATATNGTALLAMGNIDPAKNLDFTGIMYAEGRINITSGSNIRGTVVAGDGFSLAARVNVTYDPSVFANPNPLNYGNSLVIMPDPTNPSESSWRWAEAPF
jgi:hypothetical protein